MAIIVNCSCKCGKKWRSMIGSGQPPLTECQECRDKRLDIVRQAHFEKLDSLSMEERLRKVEEWIYDYKPKGNPLDIYL